MPKRRHCLGGGAGSRSRKRRRTSSAPLFWKHCGQGLGDGLQLGGVSLDLVHIACAQARLHVGDRFYGGGFIIDNLLGNALQAGKQLHDIFWNDGKVAKNGQKTIQNLISGARIFNSEGMQRADGAGQLDGDLLNGVDHLFVLFDDLDDVGNGAGEFVGKLGIGASG